MVEQQCHRHIYISVLVWLWESKCSHPQNLSTSAPTEGAQHPWCSSGSLAHRHSLPYPALFPHSRAVHLQLLPATFPFLPNSESCLGSHRSPRANRKQCSAYFQRTCCLCFRISTELNTNHSSQIDKSHMVWLPPGLQTHHYTGFLVNLLKFQVLSLNSWPYMNFLPLVPGVAVNSSDHHLVSKSLSTENAELYKECGTCRNCRFQSKVC